MRSLLFSAALAVIVHGLLFTWKAQWLNKTPLYAGTPRPVTVLMTYKKAQAPKPSQLESSLKPEPQREPIKKEPPKKVRESKPISKKEPPPKPKKKPRPNPETRPKTVKKEKDMVPPAPPPPPRPEPAPPMPSVTEFHPEEGGEESPQPKRASTSASSANEGADPIFLPKGDEKGPSPPELPLTEAIPHYKKNPPPAYPRMARRRGYEGTVLMEVMVSREGRVEEVRLLESSGHGVLDREAMSAVKGWVFEPARRGEEKVDMWVKVPVRFKLK